MEKRRFDIETIWRVDVSDEFLTFTQEPEPEDFKKVATEHDYKEYGGLYCGNRGYDDPTFQLHRNIKWKDEYYEKGIYQGCRQWRMAYGFAYAWSPQTFYDYKGQLYCSGCNFM